MSRAVRKAVSFSGVIGALFVLCVAQSVSGQRNERDNPPAAAPLAEREPRAALIQTLPADTLVAYAGRGASSGDRETGAIQRLFVLVDTARRLGLWPQQGRGIADVGAALPLLGAYPHALALLDVSIRQLGPGSFRLNELEAVLALRTGGNHAPVVQRIGQFILSYTNDQVSRISDIRFDPFDEQSSGSGGLVYHRLTDRRWPAWVVVEWGAVGETYLIGVGRGVWERAASSALGIEPSLGDDEWFQRAYADCGGAGAHVQLMLNIAGIVFHLQDDAAEVTAQVRSELGMGRSDRRYWAVGREDRAITILSAGLTGDRYWLEPISDPRSFRPEHLALVPPEADRFSVMRTHLGRGISSAVRAYLAARSPRAREALAEWWKDFQIRAGVDAQRHLLDRFGDTTVLHTWPAHPLGLPFLCTFLFEIRGDPAEFRNSLNALFATSLRATTQPTTRPERSPFSSGLKRTEDGIWYYQAGVLVVLGLAVQDRWLVVSFSPEAVRANVNFLRTRRGAPLDSQPASDSE